MSCLSIFTDDISVVCAKPIFLTSGMDVTPGAALTFEVFVADAALLESRIGQVERYLLDTSAPFWAQLTTLEPCVSTHVGLRLLRNKPTLRGVLTIQTPELPNAPTIQ